MSTLAQAQSVSSPLAFSFDSGSPSADEAAGKARVLVVDDSRLARIAVGRMIQRQAGLSVIEAANGVEALEVIAHQAPAAVLTDLHMPRMGGLELVAAIREKHPQIPVILMTAFGSEDVAIQALRAGATNYVPKKDLAQDLAETLQKVLTVASMDKRRQRVMAHLEVREARFRLRNEPELIAPLIELLLEDLSAMDLCDPAARIQVGVALQEALTNALYHGNLEVSSDLRQEDERQFYAVAKERRGLMPYRARCIEVHARVDTGSAIYEIKDEGPGFDTSSIDRPIDPEDLLRVGGRGLLLIRAFMDQMEHNRTGNRITMIKRARDRPGRS